MDVTSQNTKLDGRLQGQRPGTVRMVVASRFCTSRVQPQLS